MSWMHRILQGDVLGLLTAWGMHFSEGGGSPAVWTTISGIAPLVLENAAARAIKRLVQFGLCAQSGTPSPSSPVAIKCNNGALMMVDDELPVGYRRLTEIKFDGDTWYETGEALTGDDVVTMTLAGTSSTGQNVFGSYNGTADGRKNFSLYIYGGGSTSKTYLRYNESLYRPTYGSGQRTITFGAGGTTGFSDNVEIEQAEFTTPANTYIGMLPNSTSPAYTGRIVGEITVGTRLKWIPCERESDGAVGYYEAINGNFVAPSGTGAPTKGEYDYAHAHVAVVGTDEVLTITASGAPTQTASVSDLFGVGTYADEQDIISGEITRKVGVAVFDGTETVSESGTGWAIRIDGKLASKTDVVCSHYPYSSETMANAPDKSIVSFSSVNVGIKDSSFTSADDVKSFLSAQYEAGTPVIVVYPLAEPVEEHVTGQPLTTQAGTNTVNWTAEVSGTTKEIEYLYKEPNNLVGTASVGTAEAG